MNRCIPAAALALASVLLAGCPDPKGPRVPTVPKVPEPKALEVPRFLAAAPAVSIFKDLS